jgi:hypothetical protein
LSGAFFSFYWNTYKALTPEEWREKSFLTWSCFHF